MWNRLSIGTFGKTFAEQADLIYHSGSQFLASPILQTYQHRRFVYHVQYHCAPSQSSSQRSFQAFELEELPEGCCFYSATRQVAAIV